MVATMDMKLPALALITGLLLASTAHAAPAANDLRYRATINYGYMDRSTTGVDLTGHSAGLTLSEKLSGSRTHFVSLGGNLGNFENAASDIDNRAASIAYGMTWGNVAPGLTLFASGFASKSWNEYDRGTATAGKTDTSSSGVGLVGGFNQVVPVAAKTAISFGSGLSAAHSYINDIPTSNEGTTFGVTPYVQVSHLLTNETHAYARMGVMMSNRDVTLAGGNTLYTPTIGINHKLTDVYSVGASYSREFAPDTRGNRFGLSVSRAF
jgi:hypothetical protein